MKLKRIVTATDLSSLGDAATKADARQVRADILEGSTHRTLVAADLGPRSTAVPLADYRLIGTTSGSTTDA
jgi:hypothetical protein